MAFHPVTAAPPIKIARFARNHVRGDQKQWSDNQNFTENLFALGRAHHSLKIIHKEKLNCDFKIVGNIDKFNLSSVSKKDLKYFLKNKNNTYEKFKYDVRKILYWSNCVVLPSYREGTPRGLLEALSVGRPIITTNAVGCREVVLNNKNGFTSKVKNVDSLYKVIKKFHLLNSENKKKMSFFARFFVVKKFNDQKVIRIYNSIINEK